MKRAAIYTGTLNRADAIGEIALSKMAALRAAGFETRCYTCSTDVLRDDIQIFSSADGVLAEPFFHEAELHVFEFGWCYPLFELLRHIKRPSRSIVCYHGVVPKALLPVEQHADFQRSLRQLRLFRKASLVLCASNFSRSTLASLWLPKRRVQVLALPSRLEYQPREHLSSAAINLMFVGRIVAVKGLLGLLRALKAVRDAGTAGWSLAIVTNPLGAEPSHLAEVRRFIKANSLDSQIRFFGRVQDCDALAKLYAETDIVVVPSLYETYGLPVVEALSMGCAVVGYDSGAIGETSQDLAQLVPTGDEKALTDAIARAILDAQNGLVRTGSGSSMPRAEYTNLARERTRQLTLIEYNKAFIDIIGELQAASIVAFLTIFRWFS